MATQKLVNQALESATDNGFSFEHWTYRDIAEDLVTCDSDLEASEPEELEPIVKSWFANSDLTYRPQAN